VNEPQPQDIGELKREAVFALFKQYSVYPRISVTPPNVLTEIAYAVADYLAAKGLKSGNALSNIRFELGSNLYRRLGDLDMYQNAIQQELDAQNQISAAALVGSYLIGYFAAAKAVTDAAGITLNETFRLGLKPQRQDLAGDQFWERLEQKNPSAFTGRYERFRSLAREVKT
jgi:hypothetical protein